MKTCILFAVVLSVMAAVTSEDKGKQSQTQTPAERKTGQASVEEELLFTSAESGL